MIDEKIIEELEDYATLDGTEIGEACFLLMRLTNYPDYVSDEFYNSLEKEIKEQLDNFKTYTQIVEFEETVITKRRELEHL